MPVRQLQPNSVKFNQPLVLSALAWLALSAMCGYCLIVCAPAVSNSATAATDDVNSAGSSQEACKTPVSAEAGESPKVNVQVADLDKLQETVASLSGKVVVVDIWSTSCAPCMAEFPHLVELSRMGNEQLACISYNVDYIGLKKKSPESYLPKVADFLQKQQATFTNLLSAASDESVLTHFKLESIPAILIYGPDGNLLHTLTDVNSGDDGLTYAGDVIPKVEALLATAKSAN